MNRLLEDALAYEFGFSEGIREGRKEVASRIRECVEWVPTNWKGIMRILREYEEDETRLQ